MSYNKSKEVKLMMKILKKHNMEMSVHACGCCDGASVSFSHEGKTIVDNEAFCNFDTSTLKEEPDVS